VFVLVMMVRALLLLRTVHKPMGRPKKVKKTSEGKIEFEKNLGECHDGEYYKLLMKDGTEKLVPKWMIDKK